MLSTVGTSSKFFSGTSGKQLCLCKKKNILIFINIKLGMVVTCNSKYKSGEENAVSNPLVLEISLISKYKCFK